jgi:2-keto-3-deoxy-L-rhamnonate aldolase RhmA
MSNPLVTKLDAGHVVAGMAHFTGAPSMIEVLGCAGYDFVKIDTEHAPISIEQAYGLVRVADGAGITPLVRVSDNAPKLILKALESGAAGVVIPWIQSKDDLERAFAASYYSPRGQRGSCPSTRAARYAFTKWERHTELANENNVVIPLLESRLGIDNLDEIVTVDGLKIIYLGPADLSQDLGIESSNWEHPLLKEILQRVVKLCKPRGIHLWTSTGVKSSASYIDYLVTSGVHMLNFSSDEIVFGAAASSYLTMLPKRTAVLA